MSSQHFDKCLLTFLVLIFAGLAFRGYHLGNDQLSAFAADNSKLFAGALLTLITGARLLGRNGDSHPNGQPPPATGAEEIKK
jgi:hypothetical protein